MSRKSFIESQGATCKSWVWSWSFVNHKKKIVIFGAWDRNTDGNTSLILSEDWEVSGRGRKQPGYTQAREHIRLIEEENYQLQTFPLIYSDGYKDENGIGPSKIGDFIPELTTRKLKRVGKKWYASDGDIGSSFPEEVLNPKEYTEGASKTVSVNAYERNKKARDACLSHHGYSCAVCEFNFEKMYGQIGEKYIHVHHVIPLADVKKSYKVDPIKDLVPVCPNCHAMIHSTEPALSINELRSHISNVSGS